MCYSQKHKDQYDKRKAKVERLNLHVAVVTMLEGPAQGEKRKVDYKWLELWIDNQPAKTIRRCCLLRLRCVCGRASCGSPRAAHGGQPIGA